MEDPFPECWGETDPLLFRTFGNGCTGKIQSIGNVRTNIFVFAITIILLKSKFEITVKRMNSYHLGFCKYCSMENVKKQEYKSLQM